MEMLSAGQQAVNRSQAKIHTLVEKAMATLKKWRLRKLRWFARTCRKLLVTQSMGRVGSCFDNAVSE